jgi:hypothetical protein
MHIVGINPKGDTHSPYMVVLCVDRAEWENEKRIDLRLYKNLIEGGEAYLGTCAPARIEQDTDLDVLIAMADAAADAATGRHVPEEDDSWIHPTDMESQ